MLKPARNCGVAAMALWDSRTLLVGRAHRGLDAAVREEAAEHDRLDLLLHERRLEVRAREAVEAPLALDDDVALGPGLFYLCPTHSRPWPSPA